MQKVYLFLIDKNSIVMKSILLKIDDKLFEEMEKQVKKLKISRNGYIRRALTDYIKLLEKKKIELELGENLCW